MLDDSVCLNWMKYLSTQQPLIVGFIRHAIDLVLQDRLHFLLYCTNVTLFASDEDVQKKIREQPTTDPPPPPPPPPPQTSDYTPRPPPAPAPAPTPNPPFNPAP